MKSEASLIYKDINCSPNKSLAELMCINNWRPALALLVDFLIVAIVIVGVIKLGYWTSPFALLVIGNRQRTLGNLLHEASHGNLNSSHKINNFLAVILIAPINFLDFKKYKNMHFKHHAKLGTKDDPDKLIYNKNSVWYRHYLHQLLMFSNWKESFFGHLIDNDVSGFSKAKIVIWWVALCLLITAIFNIKIMIIFILYWLLSRATVFHAITIFREMCDHYNLIEGSVFTYTHDISNQSILTFVLHPRNDGYHLTHHLAPKIPYYKLKEAHKSFRSTKTYKRLCIIKDSYFFGDRPVVSRWN